MAVDESLNALNALASSNTPAGSDQVGTNADDHLRDIKKNIRLAAENSASVLNPTGFEGQFHADKSRSASHGITIRFHEGNNFMDMFEVYTASDQYALANLQGSSIARAALTGFGAIIDASLPLAVANGGTSEESTASLSSALRTVLNLNPMPVVDGGTGEESSASLSSRFQSILNLGTAANQAVGTAVDNVPQLTTASATSAIGLPAIYGDRLLGLGSTQQATEQSPTSGTTIDFTGIPAGTQMIKIHFVGLSAAAGNYLVSIGDAGGLETTGYTSQGFMVVTTTLSHEESTAAFVMRDGQGGATHGVMTLTLEDAANFTWVEQHEVRHSGGSNAWGCGSKSLSAELDRLRITTGGTLASGSVNCQYFK